MPGKWQWDSGADSPAWDENLSTLRGHPLQSALWGDARRDVDGITDFRWQVRKDGQVVWMARFEERQVPFVGRVAWIPRGPTAIAGSVILEIEQAFFMRLREAGFVLVVTDRWLPGDEAAASASSKRPRTIWLDLAQGSAELWRELDGQWRYGVGRARREGVVCEQTQDEQDIASFFSLCRDISHSKGFPLPGSLELMTRLLRADHSGAVSAHLLVARNPGGLGAGACILRCGRSAHYLWGASDRKHAKFRAGEAVQWAVIEWAVEQGCDLYDLEGIDPVENPGVYEFKKKMGGVEVTLEGMNYRPLDWRGILLDGARRFLKR